MAYAIKRPRLPFLDWMRGVAAVIMLQGHTFHSFVRNDLRNDGPYVFSQFAGGVAPAIFLFLTGITFSFSMERADRQGKTWQQRLVSAMKRSRYLFILAFVFRFQLWLFSGAHGPISDLLKVDVLNCMGATMLLLAPLAIVDKVMRVRLAGLAGLAVAVLSPLISMWGADWLPWPVRIYFVPSFDYFSLFPWAAFLAFGVAAGSVLKSVTADQMNRLMQWSTIVGFLLAFGGQYISNLPYNVYPKSDFWLNSPLLVLIKLGAVMIFAGMAYLWSEYGIAERWSWLKQIGTTSLLVYWVHIEIVYGRWFGFWKERLDNVQCALFASVLIVLMLGLSIARKRWGELQMPHWVPLRFAVSPPRVSGD